MKVRYSFDDVKIINGKPPNYDKIAQTFKLSGREIFAYNNVIYAPGMDKVPPELIAHEMLHFEQQAKVGVKEWWDKYLVDTEFRLHEELEAHQVEYRMFCNFNSDKNHRAKYLDMIAARLSSEMYGKIVTKSQATKLIKNGNKF